MYMENNNKTQIKVALFCNARNEKNIKEWASHHLLIGFDFIVIFDHKSIEPLTTVFLHFDKRVRIINTDLPDGSNIKTNLMNVATTIAKKLNVDWFIYLDADEFLILNNKFKGVKHLLATYSRADSLGVNWLMFGSNHFVTDPSGLILENYTKSRAMLDIHVKSFVRPNEVTYSDNPHYYKIKNPDKMMGIIFNIIPPPQCFNNVNMAYQNSNAYVAHYVYQSEETYLKRKINLPADDGTIRQHLHEKIHDEYNDVINYQPQKYVSQIKRFLQQYSLTPN